MSNRILGLDIGPGGVKAVQITAELNGRFRITAAADYPARTDEGIAEALKKIREDGRFYQDACITALPANAFSFRNLRMPFREKRKIRQTLNFELEPLIPYAIDEVVADFAIVDRSETSAAVAPDPTYISDVFAAAAPREAVQERLRALEPMRVPVIEIETVPTALNLIAAGNDRDFHILLDVGSQETVAVFFRQGKIFQVRSFAFGGDAITAAVSRSLGIDPEKAEQAKKAGDVAGAAAEIASVCDKFFGELDHTLEYMNLRRIEDRPARIFVTGGGALYEPFNTGLARFFSAPVEKLDIRTMCHISIPADTADAWNALKMNNALALALRGVHKSNGFNFRRNEFAGGGYILAAKENIRQVAVVVLILFGILAVDSVGGFFIDQLRLANLKTEISGIFKKSSPETIRVVDPVQQLKTKVIEAKKFAGVGTGTSAGSLELLRKISETVPASLNLLISDLNYDGEKLEIRAETADFDSVEKIKRRIAGSGFFRDVAVSAANMVKDKNKVEFELRMNCAR